MQISDKLWLLTFPFYLGLTAIVALAILYIRWDTRLVLRRGKSSVLLSWKAFVPSVFAISLFSLEHWAWSALLPWFAAVLAANPYDNRASSVIGRSLLHIFAAMLTYLFSDALCRFLLRSAFYRHREPVGPLDS